MATQQAELFDTLVIGAGFGGLATALALSELGARVCLCETLKYPGGCASTFQRAGFRFDAGATLISGFEPTQLFGAWLAKYSPQTVIDWIDPLVDVRAPGLHLSIGRDRQSLLQQLSALPGAPVARLRTFFAKQQAIAQVLWSLFDDATLLPPFSLKSLARHAGRGVRYAPLGPLLGRSLASVLASYELAEFAPLRTYVDALCQITVQCSAAEAEASFALAAMDYYYRGTAHVRGGVGALATALMAAASQAGAEVQLANRVLGLRADADGTWTATTRRGEIRARSVVANLLPSAMDALLDSSLPAAKTRASWRNRARLLDDAWGAAMLYVVARTPPGSSQSAHHLQLIGDSARPLVEGNHLFVSASSSLETERAPPGQRTLTISTHVPLATLRGQGADAGLYIDGVHRTMRQTLAARAPEWFAGIERELTASPRTFARFVGRPLGAVGGLPRRVGMGSYAGMGSKEVLAGLWMVGDSVFPGQSALATAIGGVRTAAEVHRALS